MSDNFVAFLMGSDSDFPVVEPGIEILKNPASAARSR